MVCEQFQQWAMEVVEDWDGLDTMRLFIDIAERTGETDLVDKLKEITDEKNLRRVQE